MRLRLVVLLALVIGMGGWMVTTTLQAQARSNDANISIMDNCSDNDPGYDPFGGCPEGAPFQDQTLTVEM